ncbi:MFS transporter [Microbacterium sp. ASV49]|uniref:MFS transporter n=1 Tax=Microbacterium candidum TaxID=3041922 RepID=A0ABT7MUF4_9MICO|nr:MFS transporter [Microbacterium sp. ASV49]MDL9978077.1 MFS transporter [Microbacterium sp. ASV49]
MGQGEATDVVPRRARWTIVALALGTTLNPLNSSMIAVALLSLQQDFGLDIASVTWVITVFYIASTIGQPLMGRVIDAFGPRRVFCIGMVVVVVAAAMAPLASTGGFWLVLLSRGILALGTSVAFPAAVALVGPLAAASGATPPRLLARIQIANTAAAALGPVVGGILIAVAGWPAIFLVNIPLAIGAFVGVWRLAPRDEKRTGVSASAVIRVLDPPGVLTFAIAAVALLMALLGAAGDAVWVFVAVGVVALGLFVWRELLAVAPFIDVRMLAANPALSFTYVAFTIFSALFYLAFFGLPQFLESFGGYSTAIVGFLLLPLSGMTVALAPLVARAIDRRGLIPVLVTGAVLLLVAAGLLGIGVVTTAPGWMLVMAAVMGIPYCIGSLAMTEAVRRSAPPHAVGVASGLLQSTRYLGAIIATVVLGRLIASGVDAASWAAVVVAAVAIGVVHLAVTLIAASVIRRRRA